MTKSCAEPKEGSTRLAAGVLLAVRRADVVTVTLNRPEARNAMSTAMLDQLAALLRELVRSGANAPRALVVSGSGEHFCSGADIREDDWRDMSRRAVRRAHFRDVLALLHEAPFPLVAAVEGYALGGGLELGMACDLVVAGRGARFGLPELGVGAVPGGGAVHSLLRKAGRGAAARMLLAPGERLTAVELEALGAVERTVADGAALVEAEQWAQSLAALEPRLVTAGVRLLRDSGHLDRTAALGVENGYWWEAAARSTAPADD